jgi:FlaA1/EpsC-like NDP-sugar epimerase
MVLKAMIKLSYTGKFLLVWAIYLPNSCFFTAAMVFFSTNNYNHSSICQIAVKGKKTLEVKKIECYKKIKKIKKMEETSVQDKCIIVTGGTTGIGRATDIKLVSLGAKVLIFGRGQNELNDALKDIKATGKTAVGLTADIAKKEILTKFLQSPTKSWVE